MEPDTTFEDLFDIEKRPGAGLELWTHALERQLDRVREVNYRHRLHHSPVEAERREDPDAEKQLHAEVYFLTLTIRRVLLFHALLARHTSDPRLDAALAHFERVAPQAKTFRDMYEHLDEYLLDSSRKHVKFPGRASPVLHSRWDCDNVVISFGEDEMDVTVAAAAAIELGKTSAAVWDERMGKVKTSRSHQELPSPDDGVVRTFELTMGVSAVIGGDDESHRQIVGTLIGPNIREATPAEIQRYEASGSLPHDDRSA